MQIEIINHPVHEDQKQILGDGRRVGYCGAYHGMPINLIVRLGAADVAEVQSTVEQLIGGVSGVFMPPPAASTRKKSKR
jgi:hypothetical protein